MKCCNKPLELKKGESTTKGKYVYYHCETCGRRGLGKDEKQAETEFKKSIANPTEKTPEKSNPQKNQHINNDLLPIPADRSKLSAWSQNNMPALLNHSAQFIDKPATQRMIEKNIRYIANLSGKSWDKVWSSPEGQESISNALGESLYYGAILGEMGDLVPYGKIAEFIPNIECYKFALETGRNAPFKDIDIMPIYDNDQIAENEISNGNYNFKYKPGFPRGEIIGVVVLATRTDTGKTIGEAYDAERLMKKAEHHSPSYRSFIIERENFQRLRVEGKLLKDNTGREYYEKKVDYKKDGKDLSFTDKVYFSDIVNPYDGPDKPEMLRKSAGKSFFRPYMKTRNASAMADEWQEDDEPTRDKACDNVLNRATGQFSGNREPEIKDADIVIEPEKEVDSGIENL